MTSTFANASVRATVLAATLSVAFGTATAAQPLELKVYNAPASSFLVNSALITGPREAVVIDAGFSRADAYRIAANVLDSGKTLTTVFVSNADPDYYFGAKVLKAIFPQAKVLTTPAVREKIVAKLPAKVAFWGPKMGANAPTQPIVPEAMPGDRLTVDGEAIEVRGTTGLLAQRPYVWVPSLHAIVGNVAVFGNMHVWTADTQKPAERQAWIAQLDEMKALQPRVVVPGHMAPGTPLDAGAIDFTRGYLVKFESVLQQSKDSAGVVRAMREAYPQLGESSSLELGAKVLKGEMAW
ncbi:MBL fold metallo-hydrolase [Paracidovorax konjaci]|uniref:Glyoxylase, beta-lactamase superfamily II n=1 Tax=Paracidovorax konjaci TaxID=32040 RepID=A0A1I1WM48_9BURK|nr:MBL fold metallo-hydrolase [Paracidovorax konjaci]SFD96152.1 Glyoxylase, beta-lactamase superfamily II [Paracidovorax konjaci]